MYLACFFCIFLYSGPSAICSDIYVPDQYATIQAAIDMAVDGDRVIVRAGSYTESIDFQGKAIEVKSLDGAVTTIIVGEVIFDDGEESGSVLDGFTVENNPRPSPGIEITRSSPVIKNNIISNHSNSGIGIMFEESSPLILNNVIRDNRAPNDGGGMVISLSAPIVVGNTFLNNHSELDSDWDGGGAIAILEYSDPVIESNIFSGNYAPYQGGAIHCSYNFSRIVLNNNIFFSNSAVRGSAISITEADFSRAQTRGSHEFIVSNNLFFENHAVEYGVMYRISNHDMVISNCTFAGNDNGSVLGFGNSLAVENCIFWGNAGPVSTSTPPISYSLVEGGYPGEGNIDADPLFVVGPSGEYYLSQISAGQASDSLCVDSGSDLAEQICFQLQETDVCLNQLTTRTDTVPDAVRADMGFHYTSTLEPATFYIVAGLGPHQANPSTVRLFYPGPDLAPVFEFNAYAVPKYGVNVASGMVNSPEAVAILTGAGPGAVFGPHVRGFTADGTPLPGLSFLAYGTNKYGVNVTAGDFDDDGFDEILTGAGPGAVFGPHVRAFDYDGGPVVNPMPGVSFFAYGTLKWGVNVTAGDLDGDGDDEIVTGAGPGPVFGAHVRGWNVDGGTVTAIPGISFFAYGTPRYGVAVGCGDVDGDGIDEIVTAPGPSSAFGAHIKGWNYDGSALAELPGLSFFAWPADEVRCGATVWAGTDLDLNGRTEIIVGSGPGPANGSTVKVFNYQNNQVTLGFTLDAFPPIYTHGVNVAAGRF
jgi:predicted outer membrane repeat protein